ncbi:Band 7 domain containing protein [uncultured Caudovirales phage]|uniref:Band 7 domain containing protein n=1 Tax=uncultured Caudovirales phage TaxID=2100421 RepID=A0A6J7WP95_9CAUD|nr:Band 7 domain containing protein [uncultured Caudovirales phage]
MKRIIGATVVAIAAMNLTGCGQVEQGNVGVRTTFGKVSPEPESPGIYVAVLSSVREFTAKEAAINLDNMTPKAKDNLSLKDLDVTVYYRTDPGKIPGLMVKYAGQSARDDKSGVYFPGFRLIESVSRGTIYDIVGTKYDSLSIHSRRNELETDIKEAMQKDLDATDPKTFTVTRVVVRQVLTDPAIEEAIRLKATREAELKAKLIQVDIERKNVEIRELENQGLTTAVLRNKELDVLKIAAEKGSMFIVPQGSTPMINVSK